MPDQNNQIPGIEPPPAPIGKETKAIESDQVINSQNKQEPGDKRLQSVMSELEQIKTNEATAPKEKIETNDLQDESPLKKSFNSSGGAVKKGKLLKVVGIVFGAILIVLLIALAFKSRTKDVTLVGNKGEIVWWGIQHDEDVYKPLIDEFEKANPGLKINYIKQSPQDYRQRLQSALVSGNGPDIFEIHNSWIPMFSADLSAIPSSVMKESDYENSFYSVITNSFKTADGIFAMPLEYDALTLYANEDIFSSAVKKPPQTWDELKNLVDPKIEGSLTIKDRQKILQSGVALGTTSNIDYWPEILGLMFYQNNVNLAKPDESVNLTADAISFYKQFGNMGVWDETLPESTTAFARGQLAMFFGTGRSAKQIVNENSNLRFRTYKLPQLPKNSPTDPDYAYASFWAQSVWERSVNKDASWLFLKYLSQPSSLTKINEKIKNYETFPIAYPRPEMNIQFRDDKVLGSIVSMALDAKAWYLADKTNDGDTGINTLLKGVYEGILVNWKKDNAEKTLLDLSLGISGVLSKYNLAPK